MLHTFFFLTSKISVTGREGYPMTHVSQQTLSFLTIQADYEKFQGYKSHSPFHPTFSWIRIQPRCWFLSANPWPTPSATARPWLILGERCRELCRWQGTCRTTVRCWLRRERAARASGPTWGSRPWISHLLTISSIWCRQGWAAFHMTDKLCQNLCGWETKW